MNLSRPELNETQEITIGVVIAVIFVIAGTIFTITQDIDIDKIQSYLFQAQTELELSSDLVLGDAFVGFAIAVTFAFELIPQMAQFIGVGAIGVRLLQTGFNPWIFAGVVAVGKLFGQMILYTVGWYIAKIHGREFKMMEVIGEWFHKWHFVVFLFPPWMGIIGDGIMLGAGHQGINPIRMIPILLATNYGEALRWIIPTIGQLELSDTIEG